jgi:hypothetical protein
VESQGVENFIGRLRDEGIAHGRSQAEAIITDAQKQAADIVAAARREADNIAPCVRNYPNCVNDLFAFAPDGINGAPVIHWTLRLSRNAVTQIPLVLLQYFVNIRFANIACHIISKAICAPPVHS